jgi:glycosyltransferase involved in cell wall biosynthesis
MDTGEPSDAETFTEGHVTLLPELELHNAGWYSAKFTASEFSNALKPAFLKHLTVFAESVIYLDCDTAVFSRFTEMIDLLKTRPLVLVPHMLSPLPRPEQFLTYPRRADIFNSGLINAGCFAMQLAKCAEFLTFWDDANFAPGAFHEAAGYQTDQQHFNWALVTVPDATVLRDSRYNVAYWNLHERNFRFEKHEKQIFQVDGRPLAFFHFSGYDVRDRLRLSAHDSRHTVYNFPSVAEILNWYSDRILSCPKVRMIQEPYRFDRMANGFALSKFIRNLLKQYEVYFPRFDTHTLEGADQLCAFLMDPLPARGSLLPLLAAEIYETRPDLSSAYPGAHFQAPPSSFWRWFCRHAGAEYGIQFLIDRCRRVLMSASAVGFAAEIAGILGDGHLRFFGDDRVRAAHELRLVGAIDHEETLLEMRAEWSFFTDLSAALTIYENRPDVQRAFPDILIRDHEGFCCWLNNFASFEHATPAGLGDKFSRYPVMSCLARIFSFLSRREDVCRLHQDSLLLDDPTALLQCLIRSAGDGDEYDLGDVVVLQYVHRIRRHLLVPLYLELPLVRMQLGASRIDKTNKNMLPVAVRDTPWADRGAALHASYFNEFEAHIDEEMRRRHDRTFLPSRHVAGFLRQHIYETDFRRAGPAYHAAMRRNVPKVQSHDFAVRHLGPEKQPGANIFGYFYSDIGLGQSSRGLAQAVALLRPVNKVPFCTSQIQEGTVLHDLFQKFDYSSDTNIFVTYPHQGEDLLEMVHAEQLVGRRNIAHLAWEQKDANCWWRAVYDRYDEIWAISEFAASPFREMFPGRVSVVPNVLDFDGFPNCDEASSRRLKGDVVSFLFVFDASSSMERKNPEGVVDAFTRAFKGTANTHRVQLTLKINAMGRPEHSERVQRLRRKAYESGLSIHFEGGRLTREASLKLIANADCYVSLHHAEGFGYTMAEAMAYGVPVIASGYSGNLEYMTPHNSFLVACKETFVRNADGPFQRGSIWGNPDIDMAAELMRHVVEVPSDAMAMGERGRMSVVNRLSAAAIAERIRPSLSTAQSANENMGYGRLLV